MLGLETSCLLSAGASALAAVAAEAALLALRPRQALPGGWIAKATLARAGILIPAWLAAVAVLALGMAHLPMIALPAAIAAMIALRLALETVARTRGRTQQALDDSRALLDSAGCGLVVLGPGGRVVSVNPAGRDLLGLPQERAGGELAEFLPPEARTDFRKALAQALAGQQATLEIALPARSGAEGKAAAQVILSAVPDAQGQLAQVAVAIADVTPQRREVEHLTAQKDAAERADRAKNDLVADMGQQIRSPMSGVIDMAKQALGTQLTPEQRGYMETVRQSAQSLLEVVNDLLDFSMLEAGRLVLEPGVMSLNDCLDRAIAPFSLPAAATGVEIVRTVAPNVPNELVGDGKRLRQVLGYLLGNALQSTSRGHVEVKADVEGRPAREVTLHLTVQDTGSGLSEKELATIFQPAFQQAGGQTRPEGGGSGLGLAIASRLVGLMGGSIRAASQAGQGCEFHFTVRLGVREKAAARPAGAAISDLQDVPVLIVDHDVTSRNILEKTLYRWRMQPTSVESSNAALEQFRKARQAGRNFALVILDAWMPDMDSFDLAEQIRNESGQGNVAIVMLSSQPKAEHLDLAKSLGIGAYLSKPFRQADLLEALGRALSRPAAGAEVPGAAAAGGQPALFVPPRRTAPTPQPSESDAAAAASPQAPSPAAVAAPPTTPSPSPAMATEPAPVPQPSPAAARPAAKAADARKAPTAGAAAKPPAAAVPVQPPPPAMPAPEPVAVRPARQAPPAPPAPAPAPPPAAPQPEPVEEVPPMSDWVEPVPAATPAPSPAAIPAPSPARIPVEAAPVECPPAAAALPPPDQSLRVLVADADPDNKGLVGRMLEKAGHLVASVSDGVEVLDALASEDYDLVLVAVEMPRLGGLETTADIRRTESGGDRHVPIVAMTGRFSKEEETRCRQAGMDAYLCQPIDSDSLLAAIDAATHRGAPARPLPAAGSR